jgi:hypothetical protein
VSIKIGNTIAQPWVAAVAVCAAAFPAASVFAQDSGARGPAADAPTGRAAMSPSQDLTGTWVSVVTEQWHLRMTVPPKGEFSMLPLTPAARQRAAAWDPAVDAAAGNACASYGAPAILRVPGRLRFRWVDNDTLQLETDSGTQTRLFHFDAAARSQQPAPSWQGHSIASWESNNPDERYLKVETTRLRPGLLRKNGAPYGPQTELDEHFYAFTEPNGDRWLVVTSIVTDPENLTRPYLTTNHFKQQRNNAGWDPTACSVDSPR